MKTLTFTLLLTALFSAVAFAHSSEQAFDADMARMEQEIRQNHPEVVWVNGYFTEITL